MVAAQKLHGPQMVLTTCIICLRRWKCHSPCGQWGLSLLLSPSLSFLPVCGFTVCIFCILRSVRVIAGVASRSLAALLAALPAQLFIIYSSPCSISSLGLHLSPLNCSCQALFSSLEAFWAPVFMSILNLFSCASNSLPACSVARRGGHIPTWAVFNFILQPNIELGRQIKFGMVCDQSGGFSS